ncbi:MAG: porin [Burkholderiaceae bacterium]|jgi:predicted porin|nr:porin [Burkholderiaceae bacterium]
MKDLPRAAACGLFILAAGPAMAEEVQVYGQIRLTVNRIQTGKADPMLEERDNASRLGIRGKEELGGGMAALFGMEMGLDADTGSLTTPAFRNSYVGLRGGLGTVALGRLDSANPTGSPLYSQVTAITSFAANDAGATAIGTSMLNARNRTSNSLGYQSPSWGGAVLRARYYLRGDAKVGGQEDEARSLDLGLSYSAGPWTAGLGYAKDKRSGGLLANEFDSKWQIGLRYALGAVEPYVLWGRDRYSHKAGVSRADVDYWLVGARLRQGAHSVVLNLMQRDVQTSLTGVRRRQQLAYAYALSKRTELQAFVDHDGVDSSRTNVAVRAIGAGVRHDF